MYQRGADHSYNQHFIVHNIRIYRLLTTTVVRMEGKKSLTCIQHSRTQYPSPPEIPSSEHHVSKKCDDKQKKNSSVPHIAHQVRRRHFSTPFPSKIHINLACRKQNINYFESRAEWIERREWTIAGIIIHSHQSVDQFNGDIPQLEYSLAFCQKTNIDEW